MRHRGLIGRRQIVGGLVAALLLSIFLLPTLYVWIARDGDKLPELEQSFRSGLAGTHVTFESAHLSKSRDACFNQAKNFGRIGLHPSVFP